MTLTIALELLYFFIPGYVANGVPPVLAKLFPHWSAPMDFHRTWGGKRILGSHKTWRGAIGGTLLGGLAFLLQRLAAGHVPTPHIPYAALPAWYGLLLAFGAIVLGDSGKSLLKRRLDIKPGGHWVPFDQLDYTLGAFFVAGWYFWPLMPGLHGWLWLAFLLAVNGLLSLLAHFLAGVVRITKETY